MKEIKIQKNDAGSRFDKYLKKLLSNATGGFIYKMLRKKNITLNGKKADGSEILNPGDVVKLFLSDETYDKFTVDENELKTEFHNYENMNVIFPEIIYEDDDILLVNKPKNILSQKANADDISLNEILLAYVIQNHLISYEEYKTFRPSVCNRLDQNTTGLLIFGKTKKGLQEMSEALKTRSAHKYYYAIVNGKFTGKQKLTGYLLKNETNNTVSILETKVEGADYIETAFHGLVYNSKNDCSLLEIELITGKTHQIRAHLSSIDHAIIGDYKYGNRKINNIYKEKYKIDSQLLHAYKLILSSKEYIAKTPKEFDQIINDID